MKKTIPSNFLVFFDIMRRMRAKVTTVRGSGATSIRSTDVDDTTESTAAAPPLFVVNNDHETSYSATGFDFGADSRQRSMFGDLPGFGTNQRTRVASNRNYTHDRTAARDSLRFSATQLHNDFDHAHDDREDDVGDFDYDLNGESDPFSDQLGSGSGGNLGDGHGDSATQGGNSTMQDELQNLNIGGGVLLPTVEYVTVPSRTVSKQKESQKMLNTIYNFTTPNVVDAALVESSVCVICQYLSFGHGEYMEVIHQMYNDKIEMVDEHHVFRLISEFWNKYIKGTGICQSAEGGQGEES